MLNTLTIMLLFASPSVEFQYVMSTNDLALSLLKLQLDSHSYTYSSTHLLEEQFRPQVKQFDLTDGKTPETLALIHIPKVGCQTVVEEISGTDEQLCVTSKSKNKIKGTINGVEFKAEYKKNVLRQLTVHDATFERFDGPPPTSDLNPFVNGFDVIGAGEVISLSHSNGGHAVNVTGIAHSETKRIRCLLQAREFVAAHAQEKPTVVLGLLVDEDTAFPHAWIQLQNGTYVDPSFDEDSGAKFTYIKLSQKTAGHTYLGLASGRVHISRSNLR
jgi:hypothetical protein